MDAKTLPLIEELESLMRLQSDGLADFEALQMSLRQALSDKDWPTLEKCLQELEFQSEGLRHLEHRRDQAWHHLRQGLGAAAGVDFYQVISRLEAPYRDCLGTLHREIKVKSLRLKGLSQGLETYIKLTTGLIQAVAGELQPLLKGRLYSREGHLRRQEAVSLVLNTQM